MTKQVLVKIQGMQVIDGETVPLPELLTTGDYSMEEGIHQIVYEEHLSDSRAVTVNRLAFSDGKAELNKDGEVQMLMVFERGKKNRALYRTPYGDVLVELHAKEVDMEASGQEICLEMEYSLTMNEVHRMDCALKVSICSAE